MRDEARAFNAGDLPGLADLARDVQATHRWVRIVEDGEELAVLQPAKRPRKASLKGKPITADDPLWNIVGIGHSDGPTDVSIHKNKYLAEAYMPKRP